MSIHIIIDGYNLIRQSKRLSLLDLQDIQVGRDTLIDMLAAYKKLKSHRITVVFDGATAPSFSRYRDRRKGIAIIFSRKGESADAVIKKMARKERQAALVVSSDQDIIQSGLAEPHVDRRSQNTQGVQDSGSDTTRSRSSRASMAPPSGPWG